jgi:hypothetical protein
MEYLEHLFPVFTAIFAVFVAVFAVVFFLQQQWFQSGHGDTQQQKEKTVILPPFWQLGWWRPGSLSPKASFARRRWFLSGCTVHNSISLLKTVLWIQIRIHTIRNFLDFTDPDPSLFVQTRIWILLSSSKKSKKNLDFYCFMTSLRLFIFED